MEKILKPVPVTAKEDAQLSLNPSLTLNPSFEKAQGIRAFDWGLTTPAEIVNFLRRNKAVQVEFSNQPPDDLAVFFASAIQEIKKFLFPSELRVFFVNPRRDLSDIQPYENFVVDLWFDEKAQ